MALLHKYDTPDHIIHHSRTVWRVARVVAEGFLRNDHPIDMALLKASCLLHDIAKYPCIMDKKGWHDVRGGEMLEQEGVDAASKDLATKFKYMSEQSSRRYLFAVGEDIGEVDEKIRRKYGSAT